MLSPSQEHCYCHRRDASLKMEGKAAHTTITMFLTYRGSMVAVWCLQSEILSSFSSLMLLVGQQEGRLACTSSATTVHKSLLLETG